MAITPMSRFEPVGRNKFGQILWELIMQPDQGDHHFIPDIELICGGELVDVLEFWPP